MKGQCDDVEGCGVPYVGCVVVMREIGGVGGTVMGMWGCVEDPGGGTLIQFLLKKIQKKGGKQKSSLRCTANPLLMSASVPLTACGWDSLSFKSCIKMLILRRVGGGVSLILFNPRPDVVYFPLKPSSAPSECHRGNSVTRLSPPLGPSS